MVVDPKNIVNELEIVGDLPLPAPPPGTPPPAPEPVTPVPAP